MTGKEQLEFEMDLKPADNTFDTYKAVGVQDFGAAMLRGMGWAPKQGDNGTENKKKGVDPNFGKLPTVRGERVGLGAVSSGESRGGYKGKRKPGEGENAREKNEREGREFWAAKVAEERKRRRNNDEEEEDNGNSSDSSSNSSGKKKKHKKKKHKGDKKKKEKKQKHKRPKYD